MNGAALEQGTVLEQRFEIEAVLGRGGFGIAYKANDARRGDLCVVKELVPPGSIREAGGALILPGDESWSSRLRRRFVEEAQLTSRLSGPGLLPVRATFSANGTAYFVTDFLADSISLEDQVIHDKALTVDQATLIFHSLLETLASVHEAGVLHRDIKPSNIILSKKRPYLIDFGAAREWHADRTQDHSIVFTPDYTPPEQLAERARRGPASDLFALCATMYRCLVGVPPPSAPARASGILYVSIGQKRADLPKNLVEAIDYGLRLKFAERPQTAEALQKVLDGESASEQTDDALMVFDARAARLRHFRFQRRQCPSCQTGVLEHPRALKAKQCPVCHTGFVRVRKIDPNLCPHCRQAPLQEKLNAFPSSICPICISAVLEKRKQGIFKPIFKVACPDCDSSFVPEGLHWRADSIRGKEVPSTESRSLTGEEWRQESGRSAKFWQCAGCGSQYDELADGRRRQMVPFKAGKYDSLYPEEWANVAAGLPPHAGNAECDSCSADYFVESGRVTLLQFDADPFGIAENIHGRLLDWESLRWLGVGKESPKDGLVCVDCSAEFDILGDKLELVKCANLHLLDRSDEPRRIEDWMRIGQDLPTIDEEEQFERDFDEALREAYQEGQIGPDYPRQKDLVWSGPAEVGDVVDGAFQSEQQATLTIDAEEVSFGGMIRKKRFPMEGLRTADRTENVLKLVFDDDEIVFRVEPLEMTCTLESGHRKLTIDAIDLEARLKLEIGQ